MDRELAARKKAYLKASAEAAQSRHWLAVFSQSLACLGHGVGFDEAAFREAMEPLHRRQDTFDFAATVLLRMLYLYGDSPLWSAALKQELKALLLDLDYWFNVKRSPNSGKEIMWTENHVMLCNCSEYLLCQFYPDEIFRCREKKGREMLPQLAEKIKHWIHLHAMVGFSEWDSRAYMPENFMSMLAIRDFAADAALRRAAEDMLALILFGQACHSYKGLYIGSQGRSYADLVTAADTEMPEALSAVLYGWGDCTLRPCRMETVSLALSDYEAPPVIARIALDAETTLESREQQSFRVEDGPRFGCGFDDEEELTLYWQNMGYTHIDIIDRNIEIGAQYGISINHQLLSEYDYVLDCREKGITPERCRCTTYLPPVNTMLRKTADYLLSCAQSYRVGEHGFQQHIWHAQLNGRCSVFTSHPGAMETGKRPDFWAGNGTFPRAAQYKDALICVYKIEAEALLHFTHLYFPTECFDETQEKDGWLLGRKDDGYVAVYSQHGCRVSEALPGTEFLCEGDENIWLCKMGRKAEHGSFADFVQAVTANPPAFAGQSVRWQTAKRGELTFGYDSPLCLDGKEIPLENYPRFENKYCKAERFSGKYHIACGECTLDLDFSGESYKENSRSGMKP